jgi:signal transduction histidine kinase/DNA-binding response OmpR family regulator
VGTGNGVLNELTSDKACFKHYVIDKNKPNASITDIKAIGKNEFYISGWGLGLYHFNNATGESVNLLKNIPGLDYNKTVYENIRSFTIDKKGRVWLAVHSDKGAVVYDPNLNKVFNATNFGSFNKQILGVPFPGKILIDSKDRIWITSYSGLYMFNGNAYYEFKAAENYSLSISSNYVYAVYEDSQGNIWVGSSAGLDKITIDKENIAIEKQSIFQQNLPKNIKNIIEDNNHQLWLSYNNELVLYNPQNKQIRFFQINKDVPLLEFSEQVCAISNSSHIFLGTTGGLLTFHQNNTAHESEHVPVYFTDFRLFNESQKVGVKNSILKQSILKTKTIYLKHNQNFISIEFTPLKINSQEEITYEYKLMGVDKDWVNPGVHRLITYANIQNGSYAFHVREANNSENMNQSEAVLHIIISPPFWKTKWAYAAYSLLLLLALYLFRKTILNREKLKNDLVLQKIKIQNVEENNLMKLRFFTNISHEFRTPLTLIRVPLEKLIKNYKQLDPEEQLYQYELMFNSTNRLDKMLSQLMDYSKMEAGSLVLEPGIGNFIEFCSKIFDNFKVLAQQKEINYTFNTQIQSIIMAFDADKLEKVLSNMLSNAFKNTPAKGKITFNISGESNQKIIIQIADNGIGIPKKDLPHIFERFYVVQNLKGVQSTGIGLALAKELIETHQGEIWVESEENKGSIFSIQIPTSIEPTASNHTSEELIDEEKSNKIAENSRADKLLIIDDDHEMLSYLKHELSFEYEVLTATNGEEGRDKAMQENPSLILSDVMMPKLDGIELCELLKKNDLTSHIPIVLLTAKHSDEAKIEGLSSGANAYLIKPFNKDVLLLTITNILNNRKQLFEQFKSNSGFHYENEEIESADQKLIQGIINLILDNISNTKINADFIAKRVFISRTVLYTKIEALTGQTVNEFIAQVRLKKAKQHLLNPDTNISEVSYKVGYSSQSYFSRSFTKAFGFTPREYVNRNKKNI